MQRERHNREPHDVHDEELLIEPELLTDLSERVRSGDDVQTEHKI